MVKPSKQEKKNLMQSKNSGSTHDLCRGNAGSGRKTERLREAFKQLPEVQELLRYLGKLGHANLKKETSVERQGWRGLDYYKEAKRQTKHSHLLGKRDTHQRKTIQTNTQAHRVVAYGGIFFKDGEERVGLALRKGVLERHTETERMLKKVGQLSRRVESYLKETKKKTAASPPNMERSNKEQLRTHDRIFDKKRGSKNSQ